MSTSGPQSPVFRLKQTIKLSASVDQGVPALSGHQDDPLKSDLGLQGLSKLEARAESSNSVNNDDHIISVDEDFLAAYFDVDDVDENDVPEMPYDLPSTFVGQDVEMPPVENVSNDQSSETLQAMSPELQQAASCVPTKESATEIAGNSGTMSASTSMSSTTTLHSDPGPSIVVETRKSPPVPSSLGKRKQTEPPSDKSSRETKRAQNSSRIGLTEGNRTSYNSEAPMIIAHDSAVQEKITGHNLAFGVQWEMGRLISNDRITYNDLRDVNFTALEGNNSAAAKSTAAMITASAHDNATSAFASESAATNPWAELDWETESLRADPFACLGNAENQGGRYGGKVEFTGRMEIRSNGTVGIRLQPAQLGASNRCTRRWGSSFFLRVKVNIKQMHALGDNLISFFCRPFIIWGKVYRAFYAKESNVFFLRTNECFEHGRVVTAPAAEGVSWDTFISWINPLDSNQNQLLCKWVARMALALSNSVPGPQLRQSEIGEAPDIVNSKRVGDKIVKSDMTDGCGIMSKEYAISITKGLGLETIPSAIQIRLGGVKGLLHLSCRDDDDKKAVYFRPSQLKIRYSPDVSLDPANLTVDILRTSRMRSPARISAEIIRNLEDNGVPQVVFIDLMKTHVEETYRNLTNWDNMFELWVAVERSEGVLAARRARESVGESRLRGYSSGRDEDADDIGFGNENELGLDLQVKGSSTAWWPDTISGQPSSLAETVMDQLDSGFTPDNCPIVREKLRMVVKSKIDRMTGNIKFEVPKSCTALVIPDPTSKPDRPGVLKRNEIFVKSSKPIFQTLDGIDTDVLEREVLITRNPCKIATDTQKVNAVNYGALSDYRDVIIVNTADHQRLLDKLGGGDYDGDTAIVLYDERMVDPFVNAPESYSEIDSEVTGSFTRDTASVASILSQLKQCPSEAARRQFLQPNLLRSLRDVSIVGKYSSLHDNAIHMYGYSHRNARRMAHMFTIIMDSPKSGHTLNKGVYLRHLNLCGGNAQPAWKKTRAKGKRQAQAYRPEAPTLARKNRKDNPFIKGEEIMNILLRAAQDLQRKLDKDMEEKFAPINFDHHRNPLDDQLSAPWDRHVQIAEERARNGSLDLRDDLEIIKQHVRRLRDVHRLKVSGRKFTDLPIERRQDVLRSCSRDFAAFPTVGDMKALTDEALIAKLRASYAYRFDWEAKSCKGFTRFPWDVAMGELCTIKAQANPPSKTVLMSFHDRYKLMNPK